MSRIIYRGNGKNEYIPDVWIQGKERWQKRFVGGGRASGNKDVCLCPYCGGKLEPVNNPLPAYYCDFDKRYFE